jgi:hypothetical protein
VQQVRRSRESLQGSHTGLNCGISVPCFSHPEGELEDLAEDVGFDFLDMSDSVTGSRAQSAGGGIRAPVYWYHLPHGSKIPTKMIAVSHQEKTR